MLLGAASKSQGGDEKDSEGAEEEDEGEKGGNPEPGHLLGIGP